MITPELQKKINQAIRLLQSVAKDDVVEVAYSGGKDSDVILQLAKEAGIKYRAIYKNTTIDPPGTLKHCKDNGVEIFRPTMTFTQVIERAGFPNQFRRFCCAFLKEYKVLNKAVHGVRRAESKRRADRYHEPLRCRWYGSKKEENHVQVMLPILEWTDQDVLDFVNDRKIKLHPLYYKEDGTVDVTQRLGCMCCPLASNRKRIEAFKKWPRMIKLYCRAGQKFRDTHPDAVQTKKYKDVYEWFCRDIFFYNQEKWEAHLASLALFGDTFDYKKYLEDYFHIELP